MNSSLKLAYLVFCGVVVLESARWCAAREPAVLNPRTYTSAANGYELKVDPTDMYGRGPADYRFTKNGETVWEKRLPFTLWEAAVSGSGFVAGYAYTHGLEGFAPKGEKKTGKGEFIVALLSPEGKVVRQEAHGREFSRFPHMPPDPLAEGLLLDEHSGRFIVRVRDADINKRMEEWRIFDLGSGEGISVLTPAKFMTRKNETLLILHAQAVPGTPLVLAQWWRRSDNQSGAVFTLIGPDAKPVWNLSLEDDYTVPGNEEAEDRIQERMWKSGAILEVTGAPSFAIHMVKERKRTSFSVQKAPDGSWQVRETSRTPYDLASPVGKPTSYPPVQLDTADVVQLGDNNKPQDGAIRDIDAFEFDAEGRIGSLRAARGSIPSLIRVTQEGDILNDIPLPLQKAPEQVKYSTLAHVGESRFVVAISGYEIGSVAEFYRVDFNTATIKKLSVVECPAVTRLAGFNDGRFAALTNRREKYTSQHGLFLFTPDGTCVWKTESGGYSGKPEEMLSPKDISHHGADAIAVLDVIRHTIQLFGERGAYLRTISMDDTWGRKPSYPTDIAADVPAGFIVYDFDAAKTLVRMDENGRIRSELRPKFPDGRPIPVRRGIKCSPQGQLWTCDGESLLRLSEEAVVDRTLGEKLDAAVLSRPGHLSVGADDRVYVADDRTKAVHVLNASGQKVGVCVPDAKDLNEISSVEHIAASARSDVFVQFDRVSCVRFGSDMKRRDTVRPDVDSVSQRCFFHPSADLYWVMGYTDVFLVKGLRETVRKVDRRADGHWLEHPRDIGLAPDGSIAVLAASHAGEMSVSSYSPAGDAIATFAVPAECQYGPLAFDGQVISVRREADVLLFRSDGKAVGRFSLAPDAANGGWDGPYCAAQGEQLWFVNEKDLTLHKYAIPAALRTSGAHSTGNPVKP